MDATPLEKLGSSDSENSRASEFVAKRFPQLAVLRKLPEVKNCQLSLAGSDIGVSIESIDGFRARYVFGEPQRKDFAKQEEFESATEDDNLVLREAIFVTARGIEIDFGKRLQSLGIVYFLQNYPNFDYDKFVDFTNGSQNLTNAETKIRKAILYRARWESDFNQIFMALPPFDNDGLYSVTHEVGHSLTTPAILAQQAANISELTEEQQQRIEKEFEIKAERTATAAGLKILREIAADFGFDEKAWLGIRENYKDGLRSHGDSSSREEDILTMEVEFRWGDQFFNRKRWSA